MPSFGIVASGAQVDQAGAYLAFWWAVETDDRINSTATSSTTAAAAGVTNAPVIWRSLDVRVVMATPAGFRAAGRRPCCDQVIPK